MGKRMDRRAFLKYSLATSVVVWAAEEIPGWLGMKTADVKELFSVNPAYAASSVFPQSVAAGDPQSNGITLWTRLISQGDANKVRVSFEIASDTTFDKPVLRGTAETDASRDYTIQSSGQLY